MAIQTVIITYKNSKFYYKDKIVKLNATLASILKGKGENAKININKKDLNFNQYYECKFKINHTRTREDYNYE